MEVICLEDTAFFSLIDRVVVHISTQQNEPADKWIDDKEAMKRLRIKSKTTLQNLRDNGKIRFSQPSRKVIVYDRFSIAEYLESNTYETF